MDWKKKLMLATGAFVSMPGAALSANCELVNGLRRRRTGSLRRRTTTVPFLFDPKDEQSIKVNVRVPKNNAIRAYGRAISRCNSYRVNASLIKLDGEFLKIESAEISAGGGTTVEFDMTGVYEPTTVTARVEVTPLGSEDCISEPPLTSFMVNGVQGPQYLPSKDLDPVLMKLFIQGPIIVK
jgi:hypothetical protein